MTTKPCFRRLTAKDAEQAMALVLRVFDEFVAPEFSSEGSREFRKYANAEAACERLASGNILLGCETGEGLAGIMELRNNSHIVFFFVDGACQRSGLGKTLLDHAVSLLRKINPTLAAVTVNASPNAVEAYRRFGFQPTDSMQEHNGIRHLPMQLEI